MRCKVTPMRQMPQYLKTAIFPAPEDHFILNKL